MAEKLTHEKFLESLKLSPRLAVELVIADSQGQILLLKRDKEPFKNYWHLPGGFLLKGEAISECFQRVSRDELGVELEYYRTAFGGLFENINGDPRSHIIHYITRVPSDSIPNEQYFSNLPEKTIPYQKDFLSKIGFQ